MYRPVGGKISSYQGFVNGKNIKPIDQRDQSSDEDDKPPPLPLWDRCEHIRSLIKVLLPVCPDLFAKIYRVKSGTVLQKVIRTSIKFSRSFVRYCAAQADYLGIILLVLLIL